MRIISSTSSSVTCSPMLMSTCRISAAPTKLFLSRSNALKASNISSSVNLPAGSLTVSFMLAGLPATTTAPAPGDATGLEATEALSPPLLAGPPAGAAFGRSNRHDMDTFPTGLFILSCKSRSPSNRPLAIHSMMLTLQRPMNLSVPTVSLSRTSSSISFSLEISKVNSSFQTGFLPPPGLGLEENSCVPILNLAYGSALPNIPWPAFNSTPRRHLIINRPNLGATGAVGGATSWLGGSLLEGGGGPRGAGELIPPGPFIPGGPLGGGDPMAPGGPPGGPLGGGDITAPPGGPPPGGPLGGPPIGGPPVGGPPGAPGGPRPGGGPAGGGPLRW
mmetsp:Transcript_3685/g.5049  ORF Transcript_3685/g.5049 Transcript_3685/m.5049 type:complete len:333 (-) Transcript_3685:570-1568(-)